MTLIYQIHRLQPSHVHRVPSELMITLYPHHRSTGVIKYVHIHRSDLTGRYVFQHLDEDVRQERRLIMNDTSPTTQPSSVIVVRDLVQRFKKRKGKGLGSRVYTAVDHLNFRVSKQSCFGLLGKIHVFLFVKKMMMIMLTGANGAGKTTTFRMLINDLRPTSGQIIINGKDIHQSVGFLLLIG